MKTILFSIALLFTTATFAQVNSETRTVGDFTGIRSSSSVEVELTQGTTNEVIVMASAGDLKEIKTEVQEGVLSITLDNPKDEVKVKITVKDLRLLNVSGASEITSSNQLTVDSLQIIGSGAGSVKIDVKANRIRTNLSGASTVKLSGATKKLDGTLSGASALKAYSLTADDVSITTSGASSAHVQAANSIDATASGASEIHYEGNPTMHTQNATTAASIEKRDGDDNKDNSSDTTNIHVGKYDVHVTENDDNDERSKRERKADNEDYEFWSGLDFGMNGYLTADNKADLPAGFDFLELNYAKSYVFGWNIFQKNIHIYRNNVNLGTGIGVTWYHYNFRNAYSLTPNAPYATATFDDSVKYFHNRLNMSYINIPLFLEFNTNNNDADHSFHFGGGMEFGYNIFHNKLKQKYEIDGHTYKRKEKDNFNVNPFRYDVIARVGYGNYTIFGSYSLSTLFEKDKGPVVYPFSAGVHISF